MSDVAEAKRVLDGMDVKCPECGKRPARQTIVALDGGMAKGEMTCCHGRGYVMVHVPTGHVVDSAYDNGSQTAVSHPAFIPMVFVAAPQAGGATVRTVGWLNEALPVAAGCAGDAGKAEGFWGKVKRYCSGLWH